MFHRQERRARGIVDVQRNVSRGRHGPSARPVELAVPQHGTGETWRLQHRRLEYTHGLDGRAVKGMELREQTLAAKISGWEQQEALAVQAAAQVASRRTPIAKVIPDWNLRTPA